MTEEPHTSFTKLESDFQLLRPGGASPETPFWEPRLDLAHVADPLIRCVYQDLEHGTWFDGECLVAGVTKKEVISALVAAHRMIHMDALGENRLAELRKAAGIDEVNPRAMQVAFAMIGQACMAACWRGKRVAMQAEGTSRGRVKATETGEETAREAMRLARKLWKRSVWEVIAAWIRARFSPSTPR